MANEFIARRGLFALDSSQITGSLSVTGSLTVNNSSVEFQVTNTGVTLGNISTDVHNATGSFNVSGSARFNGNTTITGSLIVTTGSNVELQVTKTGVTLGNISTDIHTITGSFSVSGSTRLNGNTVVTGSLTTTGTIIAQTLNVQQVTSSVVFSSGSNVFGNSLANTQRFTGSMLVTGSLTVAGAGTFSNSVTAGNNYLVNNLSATKKGYTYQSPASNWGPQVSGLYFTPNNAVDAQTTFTVELWNGVGSIITPLTIASTGAATFSSSVTASTFTSTATSGIFINNASGGTNATQIRINNTSGDARFGIESSTGGTIQVGTLAYAAIFGNQANNAVQFTTNGTARMTIAAGGNVGIGLNIPDSILEVRGSTSSPQFRISRSEQTNQGLTVQAGGGVTVFNSYDGTDTVFGSYTFNSTKASTTSTRMRIDGSGNVGIGTASPSAQLNVGHESHGIGMAYMGGSSLPSIAGLFTDTSSGQQGYGSLLVKSRSDYAGYSINFFTAASANTPIERLRITSGGGTEVRSGNILSIYRTDNTRALQLYTTNNECVINSWEATSEPLHIRSMGAGGRIQFFTNSTERMRIAANGDINYGVTTAYDTNLVWRVDFTGTIHGRIFATGAPRVVVVAGESNGVQLTSGATSWTSNSDERLKDINCEIENAVEKLLTLRTVHFSWKADKLKKENLGLIAQDVEKQFPQLIDKAELAITGEGEQKDETQYLGIRYTELIPVLVKAIQELKAENDTLKYRIETIEQA